ncbi:MAG TPA: class I SAM-dependent RNA methyltransferase, partial [Pyrinomonadaceae bacterium]|nr:class I SAM-dependent RNA methyltransferase [Pyrinomonadaceae bacterium]
TTDNGQLLVMPLRVGDSVEVEIERLVPGGAGLAHAHGRTLFVALAAPGDRVRVRIERMRGGVAFAAIAEIITPAPARIEPPCPYFGRCGGCDFQQLTYAAQLEAKVKMICDCLRRIARLAPPADIPITPAPDAWHYRARAQWQYDRERKRLGYFERGSHTVCDVAACPVVVPALQTLLSELRAAMPVDSLPEDAHDFQGVVGDDDAVSLAPPVWTDEVRETVRTIAGEHYRFDAACFFQINHALLEPLVRAAIRDAHGTTAVDLYCGVGLFTLPLARRFERVIGVEANARACAYARRNLTDAQLTNARIEAAPTGQWLTRHARKLAPVALVLLDPPRTGADAETLRGLLTLHPQRIAYVSCDPATLARDLRTLVNDAEYTLDSIAAFDMFPQTHHVETIAHLSRKLK